VNPRRRGEGGVLAFRIPYLPYRPYRRHPFLQHQRQIFLQELERCKLRMSLGVKRRRFRKRTS
jgi:hypothetical protein